MELVRCSFNHGGRGPQCCIESADGQHDGHHRFKCAGESCPGLVWPASVMEHPGSCGLPKPQAAARPASRRPDAMFFTLHTDSPGRIGERPFNEIAYPGYARVHAERAKPEYLGWTLAGRPVSAESQVAIVYPLAIGPGVHIARNWGACSEDGLLIFAGTLHPPIHIEDGVTPRVNTSSLDAIARAIEENLRATARLLTAEEAARLKKCVEVAEEEGLLERGPNFEWLTQSGGEERAALDAAIDRVTAPAAGSGRRLAP